ncbi:hypothetical protein [Amycolatopsis suaedae]|uniref:SH3 domain-containing protein n=1 Tax=Amycolatopsis suaedae TaxID=2510978 RepID=A0A4Q7J959_9PSEU|nr:hypothetical protein [Amycolatopsis suaedae]RZQ64280.1 hypothetical protein EWH70_09880 [Amycolatopsis suaedae]
MIGRCLAVVVLVAGFLTAPGIPAWSAPADPTLTVHDLPVREFGTVVDTVTVSGGGEVDVRGRTADGQWTEWVPAAPEAVLPARSVAVQARVVRPRAGEPRVDVHARFTGRAGRIDSDLATYRVFATREGLVGGKTANGHIITQRDHFVALPSRRGLSARAGGDYTVRVCTTDGARCEWAPVWDVGPWNTKDDYWNLGRASWPDLPRGMPQAQAAYQKGHNGGKDQFGRKVANPAGIDLADGTFWDGLKLKTNAWVDVTYEWTGQWRGGTVMTVAGDHLNVRDGTNSAARQVGIAARHARIPVECAEAGELVDGTQGSTDQWLRLTPGRYVSAAYVRTEQTPAPC